MNDGSIGDTVALAPKVITKRNGKTVSFNPDKIKKAVERAYNDVHMTPELVLEPLPEIQNYVVKSVVAAGGPYGVEHLQNLVEKALMEVAPEVAKEYIIYREAHNQLRSVKVNPAEIANYIHGAKYARYLPSEGRREVYKESVNRVHKMHTDFFGNRLPREKFHRFLDEYLNPAFKVVHERRAVPSMRSMQFGGKAVEVNHARGFNCSSTLLDRPRVFSETLFLLLCGCGVGFSCQREHVARLPAVKALNDDVVEHHTIEDTIEGWAVALDTLVNAAFNTGNYVEFGYYKIRPKGAPLVTSGGLAPGHIPLKLMLETVRGVLRKAAGRKLRPIEAHDMMCYTADCVLAGGIRRSSLISLFSADDDEMMNAKAPENFRMAYGTDPGLNNQRQMANNSPVLLVNEATKDKLAQVLNTSMFMGDPGLFISSNKNYAANPCVTDDTWITTSEGLRQVKDLIGTPFDAMVNGQAFRSTDKGFFYTGTKDILVIETDRGQKLKLTSNHQVLIKGEDGGNHWVEAGQLNLDDEIVVHDHYSMNSSKDHNQDNWERGYLLGCLKGDGNRDDYIARLDFWGDHRKEGQELVTSYMVNQGIGNPNHSTFGTGDCPEQDRCRTSSVGLKELSDEYGMSRNKNVTPAIEQEEYSFIRGFLSGWFDADGTVGGNLTKGVSVRLCSIDVPGLESAQRMLASIGIRSKLYKNRMPAGDRSLPDGKGGMKMYPCQAGNELVISRDNVERFAELVNFKNTEKVDKLNGLIAAKKKKSYRDTGTSVITSITPGGVEKVYDCTVPGPDAFDANGLYVHNCVEIKFFPALEVKEGTDGSWYNADDKTWRLTGFAFCNLTEINMALNLTVEKFYEAVRAATVIGTAQAAYTNFPYLTWVSKAIADRDALIGVSLTGMCDNPEIAFDLEILRKAAQLVCDTNKEVAALIGVNIAARATCIKPSGTASLALGCVGSGIHAHHAKRYFRRVTANPMEPIAQFFKKYNPHAVDVKPNGDWSLVFPIQAPDNAMLKDDLSAVDQLNKVADVYENWVKNGTQREDGNPDLHNSVSCTISFDKSEAADIVDWTFDNKTRIAALSFVQKYNDKAWPFPPLEAVRTKADMVRFQELVKNWKSVPYNLMVEDLGTTLKTQTLEAACAGGACELR